MRYGRTPSLLAGMDDSVLRQRLAQMQQDYLDLSSGRKAQSGSYTQGDGSKTITYTPATIAQLSMAIRQLQAELGIIDRPRRAFRPVFS